MAPFLLPVSLAAALLQGVPGQPCEPCRLVRELLARGDSVQARQVALRYGSDPGGVPEERARLLYLFALVTPDSTRILPAGSMDSVPAREWGLAVLESVFDETMEPGDAGWSAFALMAHREGEIREVELPRAARLARRVQEQRPGHPPVVEGSTLAELMALRARQLRLRILDGSAGLTARAPPARYVPCLHGGDPKECWIEERVYGVELLAESPPPVKIPHLLVARRRELLFRAVTLAPELPSVVRPLLADLAEAGEWDRFYDAAQAHADATGESGWSLAWLATAFWRGGMPRSADSLFGLALERFPPAERDVLLDVSASVTRENEERYLRGEHARAEAWSEFLLQVSDPLFLTPINERRLEHLARVVLSEIRYDQPDPPVRGSRTDKGRIHVRYGAPLYEWKVAGSDPRLPAPDSLVWPGVTEITVPGENPTEAIFWHYGPGRPDFLFERRAGDWLVRHTAKSREYAGELRSVEPSTFDFPVGCLPNQVARFLGGSSDVEVEFYARVPGDTISTGRVDVEAGLFFLPRRLGDSVASVRASTFRGFEPRPLLFRVPLDAGDYVYALELLSEDWEVRLRDRRRLELVRFAEEELALSDLVLARSVEPRRAGPRGTRDFRMEPAVNLAFRRDEPLHLYVEVYPGRARAGEELVYEVSVRIRSLERPSLFSRAVRTLGSLFGSAEGEGSVRWGRRATLEGDRIPEWFRLEADWAEPGLYELTVEVRDEETGSSAVSSRPFRVLPEDEAGLSAAERCGVPP